MAVWQTVALAAPATHCSSGRPSRPCCGGPTSVKAAPCSQAGGANSSGPRPQASCTASCTTSH